MPPTPSIRNPERALDQALDGMQAHLRALRPHVIGAMAEDRRLRARAEAAAGEAQAWERRAMRALQLGDEDLARAALMQKGEAERRAAAWRTELESQRRVVENLKASLERLTERAAQARRNRHALVARAHHAMAMQRIQATLQGLNGLSAFETLARLEDSIDRLEAEAEAQVELAAELGRDEALAARFARLERQAAADDELAALRARMALDTPARQRALPPGGRRAFGR